MLRAVIIDDTDDVREKNAGLIKEYCRNVALVAEADSVKTGIEVIRKYVPDLVFLDIEMRDGTGFDLLQQLQPIGFKVIFITAYEDFAIKAFKFSAIDYLMKPIDIDELIAAVRKAEDSVNKKNLELQFNTLFANIERPKSLKKIILRTAEKVYSVNVQDIVRAEADGNYTTFFLLSGQRHLISIALKEYDQLLSPMGFFRSHQSHLINMAYFDHFIKGDAGSIVMKDKTSIPLATRKKEEFLKLLQTY